MGIDKTSPALHSGVDMETSGGTRFARRLKELREGAGLTQQQLGERAGLHKLSVAKLEQALREPTWATVQALADALGVSCEAFREKPGPAPEPQRGRPRKAPAEGPADGARPPAKRPRGRPPKAKRQQSPE
jgi:transcriptional regulator with XRE-family HTH domain